jgi:hypothetical protein
MLPSSKISTEYPKLYTLCAQKGSKLARIFDPTSSVALQEIDGALFTDRDPDSFAYLLNFLWYSTNVVDADANAYAGARIPNDLASKLKVGADSFDLEALKSRIQQRQQQMLPSCAVQQRDYRVNKRKLMDKFEVLWRTTFTRVSFLTHKTLTRISWTIPLN